MQERERNNKRNSQECCSKSRMIRDDLQHFLKSKRGYSAKGSTLLPLALRPRLASARRNYIASVIKPRLTSLGTIITGVCIISAAYCAISNVSGNISNVSATSVTLTLPESIAVNVNPAVDNGFAESDNAEVAISTGNQAGYTLNIKAKDSTNGNALVNDDASAVSSGNNKLNSITESLTADQYKNGNNGNDYYNTWGFKPDVLNSQANTSFVPGPTTDGILLAKTNTNSLLGETFNLAIATKVNEAIAAGNYSNNFVLTATGNTLKYSIKFNNNGGTGGPTSALEGNIAEDQLEVQLDVASPTMEGKDFLGWCSKKPLEDGTCTGVVIQPLGCFPLCKCDLDITLYAMFGTKSTNGGGGNGGGGTGGGVGADGTSCTVAGHSGKSYAGYCWQWMDGSGGSTWDEAKTVCNSMGWALPTKAQFEALVSAVGSGAQLYQAGWSVGYYWSSTPDEYYASLLSVANGSASIANGGGDNDTTRYSVRCVSQ